ncbi:hypothetical protein H6G00_06505 [Leptolyngbya sp. FACHB-541]|uniref:DUF6973 domain-containing protein n=1 Tax=Leptolyngbya sp. FACHB-541 TaxID=2692810 RepID=UPI001688E1F4|nr:hypothetical protein [Leptolyngbya sp. FACHB-541]MBD1996268.1 hypothetical protein [Leptolyngbya sp. FACHB-541]
MGLVDELVARIEAAKNGQQESKTQFQEARDSLKNPKDILKDPRYQVEAARETKFFGWKVTVPERTMLEYLLLDSLHSIGGPQIENFYTIYKQANNEAIERFPDPSSNPDHIRSEDRNRWLSTDGHRDAFRHTYWNSLLTKDFGEPWAADYATAHEATPNNWAASEAMDLHNNEVGRRIATDNPDASPEELADLVRQALDNGELIVLDKNGEPVWNNDTNTPVCGHGLAAKEQGEGGQPAPDGYEVAVNDYYY